MEFCVYSRRNWWEISISGFQRGVGNALRIALAASNFPQIEFKVFLTKKILRP